MKINVMSDLHLEMGGIHPPSGEVLVLAGDIATVDEMANESTQGKYFLKFFNKVAKSYEKVFYVMGNHEYYFADFQDAEKKLRKMLPDSITLLNNQSEYYEGVHFVGSTLWTNFNEENADDINIAWKSMNDYQCILNGEYGKLAPMDVIEAHDDSVQWLNQVVPTLKQGPIVMITHHAPSLKSLKGNYASGDIKHSYASDLESFIEKHPEIKLWCHGHIHESNDYEIGSCRVVSNPRGYSNFATNPDFDVHFTVDV